MDDSLRLLDVAIHAFRGFVGRERAPLRFGDVTLLVGANGHGKTTVFDAIDWAVFGDGWRWSQADTDVTRGLRRPDDVPAVTVHFQGLEQHRLVRNGSKATWNGEAFDPRLLCRNASVFARSAELVQALRGVTYLPQEQLRELVASSAEAKRHSLLAALAGVPFADRFERNVRNTVNDQELRKRAAEKLVEQIVARKAEVESSLWSLRKDTAGAPAVLAQVAAFVGIESIDLVAAPESLSRKITEVKYAAQFAASNSSRLRSIGRQLVEAMLAEQRLLDERARLAVEHEKAKAALAVVSEAGNAHLEEQARVLERLREQAEIVERSQVEIHRAEQAAAQQRAITNARSELGACDAKLENLRATRADQRALLDALQLQLSRDMTRMEELQLEMTRAASDERLWTLRIQLEASLGEKRTQRSEIVRRLGEASAKLLRRSETAAELRREGTVLRASLRQSLEGEDRLTALLGEIIALKRPEETTCIVCGHDHGSSASLHKAMEARLEELAEARRLTRAVATVEKALDGELQELAKAEQVVEGLRVLLDSIEGEAARIAAQVDQLNARLQGTESRGDVGMIELGGKQRAAGEAVNRARASVESVGRAIQTLDRAIAKELDAQRRLTANLATLLESPDDGVPISEAIVGELRKAAQLAREEWQRSRARADSSDKMQAARLLEASRVEQQVAMLESTRLVNGRKLEEVNERKTALFDEAVALNVGIAVADVRVEGTIEGAAMILEEEAVRQREVMSRGLALEQALMSVAALPKLQAMEGELATLVTAEAGARKQLLQVQRAQGRLSEIETAVKKAIGVAASRAISNAGERINQVLAELCPHQHLNVMDLAQTGSLLATDDGSSYKVKPEYYGSTGQLGCMGLSVFLGIALGQEWSRLRILLLDEPVQNMDDVNFVRFLDLVRRLAETHQVVVSTADKNIGDLLRRKLMLWADGRDRTAIVHRFVGFDVDEGPSIESEELNATQARTG